MSLPTNATVWAEIPVTDMTAASAFYEAVLGNPLVQENSGPNPMAMLPYDGGGVAGHIYPGTPPAKGTGPTVHLGVPGTAEEAIQAVRAAGGEAHDMVIEIPPGRFAYATDLDGNSIGLFEVKQA